MTETLTPRRRVIRTLNHQPVDRYPIDLGMHPSTGISAFAYQNLREHLGLTPRTIEVPDAVQMLARVDYDVLQRFHIDCIMLQPRWRKTTTWRPRSLFQFEMPADFQPTQDASGEWTVRRGDHQMRMPPGGFFFDGAWLSDWSGMDDEGALAAQAAEAERIYKETPYATCYLGYGYGPHLGGFFWGLDHGVQMLEEPEKAHEQSERNLKRSIEVAGRVLDRLGKYVQMIAIGDDMGTQAGPMCRPSTMAEFVFPYYQRFCDFVHRNSDVKVFLHCCGSVRPLIPMMIEAGIDVLNPVQISASDMDAATLAKEFGGKIVFWGGGCDTQNVLGQSTPDAVRANVRQLTSAFKPTGSFVFNQVHNIMGNVPPENIVAMLDEAYARSFYQALRPTTCVL